MLIDTHAHLNFPSFKGDRREIIQQCLNKDIWIINVGTDLETSKKAVQISETFKEGVYAAVGHHPLYFKQTFLEEDYEKLADSPKVVAIGEIGLDYLKIPKDSESRASFKQGQETLFKKQLDLAGKLNLPIIIHCRMAHHDLIEILKEGTFSQNHPGVIHCFTGNWKQAQQYLDLGFYLGFNGIIYKLNLEGIIKKVPLDRIVVETDCPYLTPPEFSFSRNDPRATKLIAEQISKVKGIDLEKVEETTFQNARELFRF